MSLSGDSAQTTWRVEDANVPGLNGFHARAGARIHEEIITATVADNFYNQRAAIDFAKFCQNRYPTAAVVVMRFSFLLNEAGDILSKSERMWP